MGGAEDEVRAGWRERCQRQATRARIQNNVRVPDPSHMSNIFNLEFYMLRRIAGADPNRTIVRKVRSLGLAQHLSDETAKAGKR